MSQWIYLCKACSPKGVEICTPSIPLRLCEVCDALSGDGSGGSLFSLRALEDAMHERVCQAILCSNAIRKLKNTER
jgi:hypothetical protein